MVFGVCRFVSAPVVAWATGCVAAGAPSAEEERAVREATDLLAAEPLLLKKIVSFMKDNKI
jgi:hypothetical protein